MGTYTGHRESHPLGGASASAAYHTAYYSDPLLYSQLRPNPSDIRTDFAHLDRRSSHAPLAVGPPSMPYGSGSLLASAYPGGGPVARTSTGTPYGSAAFIGGVYPGGGTIAGLELRGSDSHGGSSDLHSQALLAEAQALGSELHPYGRYSHSLLAGLQPYGRNPSGLLAGRSDSQRYGESLHAFAAAGTALSDALLARGTESYGQRSNAFLAGANAKAFAAQMAPHGKFPLQVYGSLAEKAGVLTAEQNVLSEVKVSKKAAEQNVLTASKRVGAAMERKRKLTLDALIKETWELHSLFRAGLAAAGEKRKISDDGVAEEARPKQKREQKTPAVNHTTTDGGGWGYPGSPGEAQPANTWDEPSKGEPEPDAHAPSSSNTMAKGASLIKEVRQEHYASNLHRIACENVAKFMGNSSDDDESDGEFYTDSDEEAPDPFVRSSDNLKSREEQAYDFFLQLFEGNQELQNLYKEQCNVGKFECLVCSSITGKPIKRFNGLVSVVMHANKIQKTKKKQEHRGYGRAVCSILGWDLRRLSALPNCPSLRPRGCLPPDEEEEPEASVQLNMEDGDDSEVEEEEKNAEALEESEDDEAKEEDTRLDVEERNHEASEDSDASEGSEESDAGEDTEAED